MRRAIKIISISKLFPPLYQSFYKSRSTPNLCTQYCSSKNEIIFRFTYVPSGGRYYYLNRSGPPLLASMLLDYYEATKDIEFVRKLLYRLTREINFWNTKRSVNFLHCFNDYLRILDKCYNQRCNIFAVSIQLSCQFTKTWVLWRWCYESCERQ